MSCICVLGVMYLCVRGIDFASFYNFSIVFWKCVDSSWYNIVFLFFIILLCKMYFVFHFRLLGLNVNQNVRKISVNGVQMGCSYMNPMHLETTQNAFIKQQ